MRTLEIRLVAQPVRNRPENVQPHDSGSEPCAEEAMRRYTSVRAVGMRPRKRIEILGAQGFVAPEGHSAVPDKGRGSGAPSGVDDHGTYEEGDPGTWEAPDSPRRRAGTGEPANNPDDPALAWAGEGRSRTSPGTAVRRPVGTTGGAPDGAGESEVCIVAAKSGNSSTWTRWSEGGPCEEES